MIRELTRHSKRVSFTSLLQDARTRVEIIVVFLAVLESIKRQLIQAQQDELFGEIYLMRREEVTPVSNFVDDDETEFTGA